MLNLNRCNPMTFFTTLTPAISTAASAVIENPKGRQFEDFVIECQDKHLENTPYGLTLTSLDRIKACRISLLQQGLPRLTSLEITGMVNTHFLNYVISVSPNLKSIFLSHANLNLQAIEWPPRRLISITTLQPVKP